MAKPLPTFDQLVDRAILSREQEVRLRLLRVYDPIGAGLMLGGIIAGQHIAMAMAAEDDRD